MLSKNIFKENLLLNKQQLGLWLALANSYTTELAAGAGFDWLVLDGEHAPNTIQTLLEQLQVLNGYQSQAVIRVPVGETWMIKQVLDIGAQTILVPMIESIDQAHAMVKAVHYPPHGVRGVGAALARASNFGRVTDYIKTADQEICLLLQVESIAGVNILDQLATIKGVDGIFIGPADLAADMGFAGNPEAPEVQEIIQRTIKFLIAHKKPVGILSANNKLAQKYLDMGANFVAVGSDVGTFVSALKGLRDKFF